MAVLLEGLEGATREYLSIMLEKLELPEIIEHEPKARALYDVDIAGLFTLEKKEVEQAKVNCFKNPHENENHVFLILFKYPIGAFAVGNSSL